MCKRNSLHKNKTPHKNQDSKGCVRETPPDKKKRKPARDEQKKLPRKNKNKIKCQHGMCKRNSPDKKEASMGCVRETPQIKMKPARDV